jgi:GNAT superfamily N-acetyltransferase
MGFFIKTGKENMQVSAVCRLLHGTFWAFDRPDEIIEKSMQKSDCFGVFLEDSGEQVGFARVVTDDTTFFWLCDVVVDEKYRGQGAGKMIVDAVFNDEKYNVMNGLLRTRDAHDLYDKFGFAGLADGSMMWRQKKA